MFQSPLSLRPAPNTGININVDEVSSNRSIFQLLNTTNLCDSDKSCSEKNRGYERYPREETEEEGDFDVDKGSSNRS